MSSVRGIDSWQDAYIFCLQPNFQDDLWLFMIFAAIQVSLAGLKLTSFFINRWARGSKVGSGDADEDNVGDDGASGGISIMGVLTLIAGALILAAYCEDEPDEKTFNVFKAGVYLNTFLFAVALIFICGLVVAFVVDILTRRRGRSITFRMFLGGTIVLSIAASFFGATGIMGLKYIQSECYEEVELYFEGPTAYLGTKKDFANEFVEGSFSEPTKEILYGKYPGKIIGDPVIFTEEIEEKTYYVYSVLYKDESLTRSQILNLKIHLLEYEYDEDGDFVGFAFTATEARCFDTTGGFGEVNGLMRCAVQYSMPEQKYAKYEEATKQIVDRHECAHTDEELICDTGSESFPLCCAQFSEDYTKTEGCHCLNNPKDASCDFKATVVPTCIYDGHTLDITDPTQKKYYCDNININEYFCSSDWDTQCTTGTDDEKYGCCKTKILTHTWYEFGNPIEIDMTPEACKKHKQCYLPDQFYGQCCDAPATSNSDCSFCKGETISNTNENEHASKCGYDCFATNVIQKQVECCEEVKSIFGLTYQDGSKCQIAMSYDPCDDATSLGCSTVNSECNKNTDCFPECCGNKKFDFTNKKTIDESEASHCFQIAPELISKKNDNLNLLGHYIYHRTGADPDKRASCKKVNGIIDPKCCNKLVAYDVEDPCHCYGVGGSISSRCTKVHHEECYPTTGTDGKLSGAFPQCCFDIGDFFSPDHPCNCRFKENFSGETAACNESPISTAFDFIQTCPNPWFLVAKEYDFEFIAEQLSKTERDLDYYQEYERKLVEQKIIEEYIYEDEDDEDYESANLTDFSEGIELTGTKIEHDEEWSKLDKKMKERVIYLRRTCQMRRKIQNLVDQEDFDGLLKLHKQIYDLDKELPADDKTPVQCNSPSFSKKKNQARFIKGRRTSHTDIFHEPNLNLTICLPPKCGTTNWQNALASLSGHHGRAQTPRMTPSDYADNSFVNKISKLKVLNTRNPFQRLVSAWRDKFFVKHNPRRQGYFLPSIRVFEGPYEKDERFSCSFEAFASSRAANPSEFVNNRHWRTVHWECSPCHFEYDLILHLEDVDKEYDYAWEKIADVKPVLREQYKNSPMAKHHPSWYWRNVPKDVAKKIYMIYFMDLAGLGYSPEECMRYIDSASEADVLSLENIIKARSNLNKHELYLNQSYLHEVCY